MSEIIQTVLMLCHTEDLSIIVVELPDHPLLKSIDEEEAFNVIIGKVLEIIEPSLKENVILSFVKHYNKSTFNTVLSDNKQFLANHVNMEYTNNFIRTALLRSSFQCSKLQITVNYDDLDFSITEGGACSSTYLAQYYVKKQ